MTLTYRLKQENLGGCEKPYYFGRFFPMQFIDSCAAEKECWSITSLEDCLEVLNQFRPRVEVAMKTRQVSIDGQIDFQSSTYEIPSRISKASLVGSFRFLPASLPCIRQTHPTLT